LIFIISLNDTPERIILLSKGNGWDWAMTSRNLRKVLESPAFWIALIGALAQIAVAVIGRL